VFDQREGPIQRVPDLFRFPLVRYTCDASESKALNAQHGPRVIIAASSSTATRDFSSPMGARPVEPRGLLRSQRDDRVDA
jgi:hypothetical protein